MSAVAIRATLILLAVAHANAFLHFPAFSNVGRTLEHSAHHCPRMGLAPAKEGSVAVQQGNDLWYRLVRPMALSSQKGRPLVVLHGGPQVPSDYLFALSGVDYRSVLFYDQLGCGRSDAPAIDQASYSVEASVADLEDMLAGVGIRDYHLLGQSWGGILAYEFLRAGGPAAQTCRSVIISNSPTSVALVEEEAGRLVDAAGSVDAFKAAHECRLPVRPKALEDAYAHAGALWRGTSAIADWSLDPDAPTLKVPAMVLRGEYDFVSNAAVAGWEYAFEKCRIKEHCPALSLAALQVLEGCAHHALLEDTAEFLERVNAFTEEYD